MLVSGSFGWECIIIHRALRVFLIVFLGKSGLNQSGSYHNSWSGMMCVLFLPGHRWGRIAIIGGQVVIYARLSNRYLSVLIYLMILLCILCFVFQATVERVISELYYTIIHACVNMQQLSWCMIPRTIGLQSAGLSYRSIHHSQSFTYSPYQNLRPRASEYRGILLCTV